MTFTPTDEDLIMPEDKLFRQEQQTFTLYGDQTVSTAAQLMDKLPNGWTLVSIAYHGDHKAWVAICRGERKAVAE